MVVKADVKVVADRRAGKVDVAVRVVVDATGSRSSTPPLIGAVNAGLDGARKAVATSLGQRS